MFLTFVLADTAEAGPRIVGGTPETEGTVDRPDVAADDAERSETRADEVDRTDVSAKHDGSWGYAKIDRRPWRWDFGFGFQGFGAFDDWIDSDGFGESFGLTFNFRWRFAHDWALAFEMAATGRESESTRTSEFRGLHSVGVQWFSFSRGKFESFLSGGLAAGFADIESRAGRDTYAEYGGYVGVGLEYDLGWSRLGTEFRGLKLHRFDDDERDAALDIGRYTSRAKDERWAILWNATWHFGW